MITQIKSWFKPNPKKQKLIHIYEEVDNLRAELTKLEMQAQVNRQKLEVRRTEDIINKKIGE